MLEAVKEFVESNEARSHIKGLDPKKFITQDARLTDSMYQFSKCADYSPILLKKFI